MFGRNWRKATGIVVARTPVGSKNSAPSMFRYVVEIKPTDGAPFLVEVSQPRNSTDFNCPLVRAVVLVEVEERSGKVRFDRADPTLSWKAQERSAAEAYRTALSGPVSPNASDVADGPRAT